MDKDILALKISFAIDWEQICSKLELELDVEINKDSTVFSDIENYIADTLCEAIEEDEDFTINNN